MVDATIVPVPTQRNSRDGERGGEGRRGGYRRRMRQPKGIVTELARRFPLRALAAAVR